MSRGSDGAAGEMTYKSPHQREPLTALEEALLIAVTGCTGLTMPDRPFEDPATGTPVMAKPNLTMAGRTAGSPDNAQGTHFFLINDSGTYFLRKLPPVAGDAFERRAADRAGARAKVQLLDRRLDVPAASAISRPISIPTASCRTSRERRSFLRSSTFPDSTSTA